MLREARKYGYRNFVSVLLLYDCCCSFTNGFHTFLAQPQLNPGKLSSATRATEHKFRMRSYRKPSRESSYVEQMCARRTREMLSAERACATGTRVGSRMGNASGARCGTEVRHALSMHMLCGGWTRGVDVTGHYRLMHRCKSDSAHGVDAGTARDTALFTVTRTHVSAKKPGEHKFIHVN